MTRLKQEEGHEVFHSSLVCYSVQTEASLETIGKKTKENGVRSSELRSCVKVEVDVLGSPSLIVPTVSVDVKQH